jgi:hypothetical protein
MMEICTRTLQASVLVILGAVQHNAKKPLPSILTGVPWIHIAQHCKPNSMTKKIP